MKTIGFVGLGKLGLPVALAVESKGYKVCGWDESQKVREGICAKKIPYNEKGAQEALERSEIELPRIEVLVQKAELIFVAVQTPHQAKFEGIEPVTGWRQDFSYGFLESAVRHVCRELVKQNLKRTVVIISTVLPGTLRRLVFPIIEQEGATEHCRLVYNPFFIAMGTAMQDFLEPEFVLVGVNQKEPAEELKSFYRTINRRPVYATTVENAELIKVIYNTYISTKIAFANTVMEMCHKLPNTDCDEVVEALALGTQRIISPAYMKGGMGDGGGCHPRDNIALSWLARNLDLSYDWFDSIMRARDQQTHYLAKLICNYRARYDLPIVLMGRAFKADSNIEVGSPARLLAWYLKDKEVPFEVYDPYFEDAGKVPDGQPSIYFIATKHTDWKSFKFPATSVVLDPWRYLKSETRRCDCIYVPIGGR